MLGQVEIYCCDKQAETTNKVMVTIDTTGIYLLFLYNNQAITKVYNPDSWFLMENSE